MSPNRMPLKIALGSVTFGTIKSAIALLLITGFLAACSFAPVYGDAAQSNKRYNLSFNEPNSRLQQIVYQDLIASFGDSNSPSALLVTVAVSGSNLNANSGSNSLDGRLKIFRPDPQGLGAPQQIYDTTRTATATFYGSSQSVSSQPGAVDTTERAAKELAQNIRLTLLSVLAVMDQNGVLDQPYSAEIIDVSLPQ